MLHRMVLSALVFAAVPPPAPAETASLSAELTEVTARRVEKTTVIPGELYPFQTVDLHAKVTGFVKSMHVDRASRVKAGQTLAEMVAPELNARLAEAESRIVTLEADLREAEAKSAASASTYQKLAEAAKTPGVVAGNDVVLAEKQAQADQARVESLRASVRSAEAAARSIGEILQYLHVKAPFNGVITERYVHPGALLGPESDEHMPLFRLQQLDRLRLTAAVPEAYTQSIRRGAKVSFTTPAYPGKTFTGVVARPSHALDRETRTMAVELDVANPQGKLAPGMYAEVAWPVRRSSQTLVVPKTAVEETTERIFVIRVRNGRAEWVDVQRGISDGDHVEVFGGLQAGDKVVLRATDEIRPETQIGSGR